jgi:hypothetical protein
MKLGPQTASFGILQRTLQRALPEDLSDFYQEETDV